MLPIFCSRILWVLNLFLVIWFYFKKILVQFSFMGGPLSISLSILRTPPQTIIQNANCKVDLCNFDFHYLLYVNF